MLNQMLPYLISFDLCHLEYMKYILPVENKMETHRGEELIQNHQFSKWQDQDLNYLTLIPKEQFSNLKTYI